MNDSGLWNEAADAQLHDRPCARFEELAALELYDEWSDEDRLALEIHRGTCADCVRLRDELAAGLGVLRRRTLAGRSSISASLRALPRAAASTLLRSMHRRSVLVAASLLVSFLAGMGMMAQLRPGAGRPVSVGEPVADSAAFARPKPPPPATSRGSLARLCGLWAGEER